jgi:hypothetical protein
MTSLAPSRGGEKVRVFLSSFIYCDIPGKFLFNLNKIKAKINHKGLIKA